MILYFLILNNLEFDHADIFADLAAIQRQFNHVIRTVPSEGKVIWPKDVTAVQQVIDMGCWSEQETFSQQADTNGWQGKCIAADGHQFEVFFKGESQGILDWGLIGQHNIENAVMAIAAARHVGVTHYGIALTLEDEARGFRPRHSFEKPGTL